MKIVSCLKFEELKQSEIVRFNEENPNNIKAVLIKLLGTDKEITLYKMPYATRNYYVQIGTCMYIGDDSEDEIFFLYVIEQEIKNGKLNIKNIYTEAITQTGTILADFFKYDKEFQEKNLRRRLIDNIDNIDVIIDKEYLKEKIREYLDREDIDTVEESNIIEEIEKDKDIKPIAEIHFPRKSVKMGGYQVGQKITCNGVEYKSKSAFINAYNLPHTSVWTLLSQGKSPEEIVEMYKGKERQILQRRGRHAKRYEYEGELLTARELSELSDVPAKIIRQRIEDYNWSVKDAVETPTSKANRGFSSSR